MTSSTGHLPAGLLAAAPPATQFSLQNLASERQQRDDHHRLSLALPPPAPEFSHSPPGYYLPSSAAEMFLSPFDGKRKVGDGEEQDDRMEENGSEKGGEGEASSGGGGQLNRRQTRLYRCLVWTQFTMTLLTCLFILVIMVLVAIILVMLQRTIDRADTAIRDNPVSKVYMSIKNAVNKIAN